MVLMNYVDLNRWVSIFILSFCALPYKMACLYLETWSPTEVVESGLLEAESLDQDPYPLPGDQSSQARYLMKTKSNITYKSVKVVHLTDYFY